MTSVPEARRCTREERAMVRQRVRFALGMLVIAMLLPQPRADGAEPSEADRIVPPSEYVEDIETPGKTGGVETEADAEDAQAEAAEKGAAAEPATAPTSGGERAAAITVDLLLGRPTSLMATVAGSAFYVLSWPITAASGTSDEALERFIEEPGNKLIGPLGE